MPRTFDPFAEALELRQQLSSDKRRVVFLCGAGTSQAVGIDSIGGLTSAVEQGLGSLTGEYRRLLTECGGGATVEHVLNLVRACRELTVGREGEQVRGLTETQARALDQGICRLIAARVGVNPTAGIEPHRALASWIRSVPRQYPVELFTTNYDVLLERGLEAEDAPHFDGFVGTYEPRFSLSSVEADEREESNAYRRPRGWTRVWKLHGSINWRLQNQPGAPALLIRTRADESLEDAELMIFPSRDKYVESRRLPFVAFHDRLRQVLAAGEVLLVICGYSFSDQHVNEVVYDALRWNNRLAVTALIFGDLTASLEEALLKPMQGVPNLTVYCADRAVVSGVNGVWREPPAPPANRGEPWPFWDTSTSRFTLGDFASFGQFLRSFVIGRTESGAAIPTGLPKATPDGDATLGLSQPLPVDADPVTAVLPQPSQIQ